MKLGRLFIVVLGLSLNVGAAQAADLPASKDPPFLKRFKGSEIVGYLTKSFAEYTLALSEATAAGFTKSEKLEGAITRVIYRVPAGHTALELLRNYEHALGEAGFALTVEFKANASGPFIGFFWFQPGQNPNIQSPFEGYGDTRYVVAKATKDGQDLTVGVLIHESNPFQFNKIAIKTGEIIVVVDVVTATAVEIKMVAVKAADMADALATKGTVNLYGIYFDTDKTDIKPESAKTLDEMASLLKIDRSLKLEIAGHTDSTGDKEHNVKLSQGRAAAVVDALVKKYGIDAARLRAKGHGDTKPIAPNNTDDGRAKNRRVELRKI